MAKNSGTVTEEEIEDGFAGAMFENNNDGLSVDLSNVQAQSFEALPKGVYNGLIDQAEYSLSKTSGKPMWNLRVAITDEGDYQSRKLFTFLSFSEKALPGTKAAMATFAPELLTGPFNPSNPDILGGLVGRPVKLSVTVETYNDAPQNRIKKWLTPEGNDGFITG